MISSILGGTDCTLGRSTFNLLVCACALSGGGGGASAWWLWWLRRASWWLWSPLFPHYVDAVPGSSSSFPEVEGEFKLFAFGLAASLLQKCTCVAILKQVPSVLAPFLLRYTPSLNMWSFISNCTQRNTLSGRIGKVVASHAEVARSIPGDCADLYYSRGAQGVLPMRVRGATSQLDLQPLAPLSVAGCGRLQLGVPPLG